VHAAYDLSSSIFHWKRGARTAMEVPIPAVRRRGATDAHFEELLRDPANAGPKAYDHSMPQALSHVAPSTLVLVTMDVQLVQSRFHGVYHVTLVDLKARKVCPDVELPLPRDPLPRVTLRADTIAVVQQELGADSASAAAIRRFVIDRASCPWQPLPS
jgi:hypothetical protein